MPPPQTPPLVGRGTHPLPTPHPTPSVPTAPRLSRRLCSPNLKTLPGPLPQLRSCIKWQSLCFILRLRFSNDVCSVPDSWKTRNSDKKLVPICLYCLKCTKFGQLVLAKIIKIVATRCHILRQKCTKFDVGWGSAPDPAGEAYSAPPDPL